jgi:hypothetical protein
MRERREERRDLLFRVNLGLGLGLDGHCFGKGLNFPLLFLSLFFLPLVALHSPSHHFPSRSIPLENKALENSSTDRDLVLPFSLSLSSAAL